MKVISTKRNVEMARRHTRLRCPAFSFRHKPAAAQGPYGKVGPDILLFLEAGKPRAERGPT
jgi:hypothetical protein